ncbi:hypothetical protein [Nocardia terpenica]|uniref:Uncharacterized protein n=1 Tax=Nocardia terpenica TaxID=455432 RepID=A0A6G9ZE01_9NOCA|nr:hypothetical protein [Nocardia terpenica]QIS23670.1 hypothetical protein F6W96_40760 [Nocardia terpenica]
MPSTVDPTTPNRLRAAARSLRAQLTRTLAALRDRIPLHHIDPHARTAVAEAIATFHTAADGDSIDTEYQAAVDLADAAQHLLDQLHFPRH